MAKTTIARPDFSGHWEFSRAASRLQVASPDAAEFRIQQHGSEFRLERTLRFGKQRDTFAIDLTIGAEHEPIVRGDSTIFPSLDWDGDDLVFHSRIVRGDGEATNVVRYHLSDEGDVLLADERFSADGSGYHNHWVFRRSD